MISIKFELSGLTPLLMHNGQLCNPMSPFAKALKEVTSTRKKSDADFVEISWREWLGGLYVHPSTGRPCVPADNLKAAWVKGGTVNKIGKALAVAIVASDAYHLEGPGCDLDLRVEANARKLFNTGYCDVRSVRNQSARIMRSRPIFRTWKCLAEVLLNDDVVNRAQAITALNHAGTRAGIGDYRPEKGGPYGQFSVKIL